MSLKFPRFLTIIKILVFLTIFLITPSTNVWLTPQPTQAASDLFFGENHSYTVIFRGNGESIVFAKLVFTNSSDSPLDSYSFEMPDVNPYEMSIYQLVLSPQCIQYDYQSAQKPCLRYQPPNYNNYSGYPGSFGSNSDYQKVHFNQQGNLFNLELPNPIKPNSSSAIILAYATKDYVKQSAGLFSFNFETLKVASRVSDVKVAVDVDSDLLLKGKQAQVNYQSSGLTNLALPIVSSGASINSSLDTIVRYVGGSAPLMKEAKDLAPKESFTVKGEYASSWLRLYLNSILISIVVIGLIFTSLFLLIKFLNKKVRNQPNPEGPTNITRTHSENLSWIGTKNKFNIFDLIFAFISVLLIIGVTYLLGLITQSLRYPQGYYSYGYYPIFQVISLLIVLFIYLFAIFGPAIILSFIKGWRSMIYVLLSEFLWCIVVLILYFILFQLGLNQTPTIPIGPRPL